MRIKAQITLDLGQLGEHEAIVEYSYGRAEPENGLPEYFEILSVKIAGMDMGKRVWIDIGPAISDKQIEQIIQQIKEL